MNVNDNWTICLSLLFWKTDDMDSSILDREHAYADIPYMSLVQSMDMAWQYTCRQRYVYVLVYILYSTAAASEPQRSPNRKAGDQSRDILCTMVIIIKWFTAPHSKTLFSFPFLCSTDLLPTSPSVDHSHQAIAVMWKSTILFTSFVLLWTSIGTVAAQNNNQQLRVLAPNGNETAGVKYNLQNDYCWLLAHQCTPIILPL